MDNNWKIETIAVQAGYTPENGGPRIVPITQSTTYKYDDAQSVADLFDLKREGFFYTRLANPTVDAFEKKIAAIAEKKGGALTVSQETCDIDGGFLLVYGGIEENCSFTAMFAAEKENLQDKVHTLLFT